jgi:hypothetical protein
MEYEERVAAIVTGVTDRDLTRLLDGVPGPTGAFATDPRAGTADREAGLQYPADRRRSGQAGTRQHS